MAHRQRPTVLTFVPHYLPGHESGGPVRSISNLVNWLGDEAQFRIVTRDRDIRDSIAYTKIKVDRWNRVGKGIVYYASPSSMSFAGVLRILKETPHDLLYLNSLFNTRFSTLPLLVRRLLGNAGIPIVVAPRGVFSQGALALKAWKKVPYIFATQAAGLHRNVVWQASSKYEADDIRRVLGSTVRVEVAPNLPGLQPRREVRSVTRTRSYPLNVLFVSRISPMKNLQFALRILKNVSTPVIFSIAGPVGDLSYWRQCRSMINGLPGNITVNIVGSVEHDSMSSLLAENDLLFLPTLGENYGHTIAEALSVGTPVLISDATPWRGLWEAGVGWDLSLDCDESFISAIEDASSKSDEQYGEWRSVVLDYAFKRLTDPAIVQANRRLFCEPERLLRLHRAKCRRQS